MKPSSVAVIDIGSNSIKALVAQRAEDGGVLPLHTSSLDARIGAGLGGDLPSLGEDGMTRGVEAIRSLLAEIDPLEPRRQILVATSAVRDSTNGPEFCERVLAATGHRIRILTGHEEASLIGRGLLTEPALRELRDFYVFDLGGGSLECLAFRDRRIAQAVSLPLGCVRLTEKFVADPRLPLAPDAAARISAHARERLASGGFTFALPPDAQAVGTGGTVATVRRILGARSGLSRASSDPIVAIAELRPMLEWLGSLPLAERRRVPGLPAARADVFPAALATLLAVAEAGALSTLRHSLHNLRYGLADEALAEEEATPSAHGPA